MDFCERCHEEATVEINMPNLDRHRGFEKWFPRCDNCLAYEQELRDDTNEHEMRHFGGAYGLVEMNVRPINTIPT